MTERPYHHGNLRAALIAAAEEVVQQQGHEAVSLRALAENLEVSRGAPYRHFANREALLAEVALGGFRILNDSLDRLNAGQPTTSDGLYAAAREFLGFVRDNPEIFRVMYEAGLITAEEAHPELAEAQRLSYQGLDKLLAKALPGLSTQTRKLRQITLWSTLYGFAKIRQLGIVQPYMTDGLSEDEIEKAVLQTAIGIPPGKA